MRSGGVIRKRSSWIISYGRDFAYVRMDQLTLRRKADFCESLGCDQKFYNVGLVGREE